MVLRIALRATTPPGLPLTPETTAAPGARKSGQAQACPASARRATPPRHQHARPELEGTHELASGAQNAENLRYRSQALESVKHHLKPIPVKDRVKLSATRG
jgi:hypothetical protein